MSAIPRADADLLLAPLFEAGWEWAIEAEYFGDADADPDDVGWHGVLARGVMLIEAARYGEELTLGSISELRAIEGFNFLDAPAHIDVVSDDGAAESAVNHVREVAAQLGLLDLTNIGTTPESDVSPVAAWSEFVSMRLLRPAMTARSISRRTLVQQLSATAFEEFLSFLALSGRAPIPDAVPPAATLGIVVCGWRNTAVEDAHVAEELLTDPVMAKLSIGATRIAARHTAADKIDWSGIENEFLDVERTLPDGRSLALLFGESWPEVAKSVSEHLARFREIEAVLTAPLMVRYVSMLGSTSYSDNWWGNPAWPELCRTVINARAAAAVTAPPPYDINGLDALYRVLVAAPDHLDDEVLRFCINGLRVHGDWLPGLRDCQLPAPVIVQLNL